MKAKYGKATWWCSFSLTFLAVLQSSLLWVVLFFPSLGLCCCSPIPLWNSCFFHEHCNFISFSSNVSPKKQQRDIQFSFRKMQICQTFWCFPGEPSKRRGGSSTTQTKEEEKCSTTSNEQGVTAAPPHRKEEEKGSTTHKGRRCFLLLLSGGASFRRLPFFGWCCSGWCYIHIFL